MKVKFITVWIIQCFREETKEGHLTDIVTVEVIADNETQAMKKAKKLVKRPIYRISQIVEQELSK